MIRTLTRVLTYTLALALALGFSGCRRTPPPPEETPTIIVEPEDIAIVRDEEISTGPPISGTLEPEIEASILAEIGGTVTAATALEGEGVTIGTLIARISDPSLAERRLAAEAAIAGAEVAAENARRDLARMETLAAAGAVARREVESARGALATAESQLSTARSQLAELIKVEDASTVEATISGIISARLVSRGDVVQIGTELYRIIDPSTMMLEADIPAEWLAGVRVGTPAHFDIRGYPGRAFNGSVRRINPTADPTTRHVILHISIPNPTGALIAGLFAEGWLITAARTGLVVPATGIREESTGSSYAMRIRGGRVEQVWVRTGIRDRRTERVEILEGLARGDTILVGPVMEIEPGTPIRVERLAPLPNRAR